MKSRMLRKSFAIESLKRYPLLKINRYKILTLFFVSILGIVFAVVYFQQLLKDSYINKSICNDSIVRQYNDFTNNADSYMLNLRKLTNDVQNMPNYEDDITCQFIIYSYYANEFNATETRNALESIKQLQSEDQKINPSLKGIRSIDEMQVFVRGLEHNESIGDSADGSG